MEYEFWWSNMQILKSASVHETLYWWCKEKSSLHPVNCAHNFMDFHVFFISSLSTCEYLNCTTKKATVHWKEEIYEDVEWQSLGIRSQRIEEGNLKLPLPLSIFCWILQCNRIYVVEGFPTWHSLNVCKA